MKRITTTIRPIALDSDNSETVRRLKAATRIYGDALAASRRLAALLAELRRVGIPYKDGSIWQRYQNAVSLRMATRRLLRRLQHAHMRKHGRYWKLKRRRVYKYAQDRYRTGPDLHNTRREVE